MIVTSAAAGVNPLTAPSTYIIPKEEIQAAQTADFSSTSSIVEYIRERANEYGVNPAIALYIAERESSFDPRAVGDGHLTCLLKGSPNYGKPIRSRGLFQINNCAHPSVSDETAFSVVSSTEWALNELREGRANIWTTWRNRAKNPV